MIFIWGGGLEKYPCNKPWMRNLDMYLDRFGNDSMTSIVFETTALSPHCRKNTGTARKRKPFEGKYFRANDLCARFQESLAAWISLSFSNFLKLMWLYCYWKSFYTTLINCRQTSLNAFRKDFRVLLCRQGGRSNTSMILFREVNRKITEYPE